MTPAERRVDLSFGLFVGFWLGLVLREIISRAVEWGWLP
jgi:hypothetical protein